MNTSGPLNLAEAEEADQQALREIFSLCFSGPSMDDAVSSLGYAPPPSRTSPEAAQASKDSQRAPGGSASFEAQGQCW